MFKPALRLGWITVHPLPWIEKPGGQKVPRKRVLSDDEIKIQWQDLDLTEGTWTQPNTKNGSIHLTPLVGQSLDILLERFQGETDGYVYRVLRRLI